MAAPATDLGSTTFLIGAGISIDAPSFVPAAAELSGALVDWLCRDAPGLRPLIDDLLLAPDEREPYQGPYATLRFELLVQWLSYFEPDLMEILSMLDLTGLPNTWHFAIAQAVGGGAKVVTTNFDTRIEEACDALLGSCRVATVSRQMPAPDQIAQAQVVKLHGTFPHDGGPVRQRSMPVGTLGQISRLGIGFSRAGPSRDALEVLLDGRHVIVSGYSAWDSYDVVPLLESAVPKSVHWHVWRSRRPLRRTVPAALDPLLDGKRHHTPADLYLGAAVKRGVSVERLTGPTVDFFATMLPDDVMAMAHRLGDAAIADAAEAGIDRSTGITEVREMLAEEEARLGIDAVRGIAEKLLGAYGIAWDEHNENSIESTLDDAVGAYSGDLIADADESDGLSPWEREQLDLVEQGRFLEAADRFLDYIRGADPETTYPYTETALWILDDLFWRAGETGDFLSARWLATRMRREARRRLSLWGQVRADFLEAVIFDAWSRSAAVLAGRRRHEPAWYSARARALLDTVVQYAFRIPHLPMLVDALELAVGVATDDEDRERLERAHRRWKRTLTRMASVEP